ncbi:Uncharacterised protein [Mycobacterium tuberculosis]|nr:Uncharacterised protein [Mycobacterium tuberculosis]CFS09689.1 Uncharacterised protein [Mycobacterium tuberculosis]CFS28220.1 Uncharacterised protein [Mycobacterium tuberculosis]CFS31677.1 Uncharacterised protein [Mycobacterium tuberculosis]CFV45147.1 Uncharacterised protein [Mycobacterium tuberculosis]
MVAGGQSGRCRQPWPVTKTRTGLGRSAGARPRWASNQSNDSRAPVASPLVSIWVCVQGPTVSATCTPRSRRCRYCCSVCRRKMSCQPPTSSTGTWTRSNAAGNRSRSQNGSSRSVCSTQDSNHGAPVPSSVRADSPSGNVAAVRATRRGAVSWRIPARMRPGSSWWETRSLQPRKSLTVNDPVPHTEARKSCGPTVITAAASSGGGSCSNAHWVKPR